MKVLYFSATGNSLYVAKRLGGEAVSIPQLLKGGGVRVADDKIGLVFPVYFLSVPPYVERFLDMASLECSYLFAVLTCGNVAGEAPSHFMRIAARNGMAPAYVNTITMIDNWLPMFDVDKQLAGEPKKQIEARLDGIVQDVAGSRRWIKRPSFVDGVLTRVMGDKYPGGGMCLSHVVEEHCNGCGVCAQVCPVGNVVLEGGRPAFAAGGISCLACTHNCPQNAIRVKAEKSKSRFRNQHVKLADIIQSNRQ
jgi:ferredoxin